MSKEIRELDEMLESLNGVDVEESIILTEDGAYSDRRNNIYIGVFPDNGGRISLDPYFKVSWKSINPANNDVARISMRTGDYVIHNNRSVRLNSPLISKINFALQDRSGKNLINIPNINIANPSLWEILVYSVYKYSDKKDTYEDLLIKFPPIIINPRIETLKRKGCEMIKWEG